MTDKPKRGGLRSGAGRKPTERGVMVYMRVGMYADQKDYLLANGGSKLVRNLMDEYIKKGGE